MSPKALVLAVVGAGSVAVAAAGGYLALRANPRSEAPTEATTSVALNSATPSPAATPPVAAETTAPDPNAPRTETTVPVEPAADRNRSASRAPSATATTAKTTPATTRSAKTQTPPAAPPRYGSASEPRTETPAQPAPPPAQWPAPSPASRATDPAPVSTTTAVEAAPVNPPPPAPRFEELTVKEDAVIGIRLEQSVSSETAKVEDRISARVTRDVTVDGRTAIPAGAKLEGTVTAVQPGGRFKERARLGIRFHSLVLADGAKIPLQTETIYRDGDSPTGDATAKIGASAVVGAIIGAAIGGKKGAAIGSAAGAAGGTGAVMAGGNKDATIAAGVPLTVRLTSPATVTIEKDSK